MEKARQHTACAMCMCGMLPEMHFILPEMKCVKTEYIRRISLQTPAAVKTDFTGPLLFGKKFIY